MGGAGNRAARRAGNADVPIRFAREKTMNEALKDTVFRLDGHPVWSRDYKKVSLQAAPNGKRQLFLVELAHIV